MDTSKEDIKTILELVKRFLPEFTVTRDDLLKLNPVFVQSFYRHFVSKLATNCQILDCKFDDIIENCPHDVDNEIFLFLFTRHILNKIGVPYFNICDFYRPSNRTRVTMKICLNFLFFIQETLPRANTIITNFNEQSEMIRLQNDRISMKKSHVSDMTHRIGLLKEQVDNLNKELESEKRIQNTSFETNVLLIKEIEQLEKEQVELLNHIALEENNLKILNEEIQELSNQIVTDDYESCKKTLEQVEAKIQNADNIIATNQKILEEKCKEFEYFKNLHDKIEKIDMSALDYVEKVELIKQQIVDLEFNEKNVIEKNRLYEEYKVSLADNDKKFQENIRQQEQNLTTKMETIKMLKEKIQVQEDLQKKLTSVYHQFKEKRDLHEAEFLKLQNEQDYLERESIQLYQKLLTCLNLVTTTFDDSLVSMLEPHKKETEESK